jgi:predicted Kef-type K+ transport protein
VFGTLAQRLRISPLVGYLLAGVLMGPFTPGYVADQHLAHELADSRRTACACGLNSGRPRGMGEGTI